MEKFRAIDNSPGLCNECGAKYSRPIYLSCIALLTFFSTVAFDKNYYAWKLSLLALAVIGEYLYFQVEAVATISENQTKYLAIFFMLLFLLLVLWLSSPLIFGKVFLPL